ALAYSMLAISGAAGILLLAIFGPTVYAQLLDPGVALAQTSDNVVQGSTFSLSGSVTSIAYTQNATYLLGGNWSLCANDGDIASLSASINLQSTDGEKSHALQISNFTPNTKLNNGPGAMLYEFGTVDVVSDATAEHSIPAIVTIANMKVITI